MTYTPIAPTASPLRVRIIDGEADSTFGQFVRGRASTREEAESLVQAEWLLQQEWTITTDGGLTEMGSWGAEGEEEIWIVVVDVTR